mmetsp:Transcript_7821/g.11397  ORF Transcript_7821/g.11397 Transcript_7821/m.11397 type:complete len:295 (+) Transcript_7821:154-1038(+)
MPLLCRSKETKSSRQRFASSIYFIAAMSLVMATTRYAVLSLVSPCPHLLPVAEAFTASGSLSAANRVRHAKCNMSNLDMTLGEQQGSDMAREARFAEKIKKGESNLGHRGKLYNARRKEWIDRSIKYYSTVMREQQRRDEAQARLFRGDKEDRTYVDMATRHYFALRKIKNGELKHAEKIYRKTIDDILNEDDGCDHARLAVSTLLLALLMQRMQDVKGTRSVFLNFFRVAVIENGERDCACSAKVLQAYALFEMKQGHSIKSLELVRRAVQMDEKLKPVLEWKQFRDAKNVFS